MNTKEQQFTTVIREHERTIYTVCYMFSSDTDEVNDLYQDILVRLWQGFDTFEGKSDIKTWIYRVSLNYCINFSNRRKRRSERLDLGAGFPSDGRSLEKNLQIKQLYKRINALGLVDRSVVLLWLEGLSYDEIGAILGISVKNVSFKLVRIKEQLKKMSNI
nr:sigma-70 family RNA polymerase sigma factor [uncultured Bacteroides sp.]